MSQYIPRTAVARELEQQNTRRLNGLKNGDYIHYPSAEAKHKFVVKATKLVGPKGDQLKADMDRQLAVIAEYEARYAGSVAPKGEK